MSDNLTIGGRAGLLCLSLKLQNKKNYWSSLENNLARMPTNRKFRQPKISIAITSQVSEGFAMV